MVIGGDAAGMSAATAARREDPGLAVTVLERGPDVSYAACGVPFWLGGEVEDIERLVAHDADYFRERRGIEVRTGVEATAIDPERRTVRAGGEDVPYDALVVATGARPVRPPVPGAGLPGVHTLRDLESARRLDAALRERTGPRVLIVGSGAVGMEMAEALCARGLAPALVEAAPRLAPGLPPEVAAPVVEALGRTCASARAAAPLERLRATGGGALVATVGGADEPQDLVLLGTGVAPRAGLAAEAGCRLGDAGAILVDRTGRTSVAGVWAAGDCATAWHRVLERDVWRPLATTANAQGRIAGRAIAGRPERFAGVLGSWVSRVGAVAFGATGVDVAEAEAAGFRPAAIVREGRDRSAYMPGARPLTVRLVWHEPTGRLLGGQISGEGEVAARLHTLAAAVAARMTVRDLAELDLGYAPPVAPLRDPLELAAAAAIGDAP